MAKTATVRKLETLGDPTNGGEGTIALGQPYSVRVSIEGLAPLLFHAWNSEAVRIKDGSAKGSKAKKTDNVESYVRRDEEGNICLPGEYLRQSLVHAAKFRQDPRSPRKSAMDLCKAGIVSTTELASLGSTEWDYLDRRRVVVQRNAVTRERPAFRIGWRVTVDLLILLPEYIDQPFLHSLVADAGRLVGVGDGRPSFGRFATVGFELLAG